MRSQRVVTVTLNPAVDQSIAIPDFKAGSVNRVSTSCLDPGGKGVNVASFLSDYGISVSVTGFLGADNDAIFSHFFERKRIEDRFVRIAGQTRTGIKIVDDVRQETTDVNFPGLTPSDADIGRLFGTLRDLAAGHDWFVLAGSIPSGVDAGIYREMLTILDGKVVVLDTNGEALCQALVAGPSLIKPNLHELEELVGDRVDTSAAIVRSSRDLIGRYGVGKVLVSMGKDGAILVEKDVALWAVPPRVEVRSTVGAGDAMVAGFVAGMIEGLSPDGSLRLATAFSVSAITRVGSGLPSLEAVESARESVAIQIVREETP